VTAAKARSLGLADRKELDRYFDMVMKVASRAFKRKGVPYTCIEHFVHTHGKRFHRRLPGDGKADRRCYYNATWMAIENPDLHYCEGFALSMIPVPHAWCMDATGAVMDPTWKEGRAYFGVVFKTSFVRDQMAVRQVYGLLEWPGMVHILKAKESDWKADV